jgi:PPOX class probable F420-dependent enzyme
MTAAPTVPDDFTHLLEGPYFAHLGTIRPDGSPQVNTMWFGWDGELVRFTNTTTRQKYRNVQADPRVALSIIDPAQPYRMLEVRGVVERIDPDPTGAFYVELARRYGEDSPAPADAPDRVILVVRPTAFSTH